MKRLLESPELQSYVNSYPYRPYVLHAKEAFDGRKPIFNYSDNGGITISTTAMLDRGIDPWRLKSDTDIVVSPWNVGTNGTNVLVETMLGLAERFASGTQIRHSYETEIGSFTASLESGRFEQYEGAHIAIYPERLPGRGIEVDWFPKPEWYKRALEISADNLYYDPTGQLSSLSVREKFRKQVIAVSGLSLGSNIAMVGAMDIVAEHYKVADLKTAHPAYLNRVRGGRQSMGWFKHYLIANELYDRNPFCNVSVYDGGINNINMNDFFAGDSSKDEPESSIVYLEEDDIEIKIAALIFAQQHKKDVIIVSDIDPYAQVDVRKFSDGGGELVLGYSAEKVLATYNEFKANPNAEKKEQLMKVLLGEEVFLTNSNKDSASNNLETEFSRLVFGRKKRLSGGFPQVGTVAAVGSGLGIRTLANMLLGNPVHERVGVNVQFPQNTFVKGNIIHNAFEFSV